ncbi:MAG: hypothetical protein J2P38_01360 [Candidatus Dormibacteraeota bacterium]|nr:hypothetical protein [Candidatus Dormibacteraeota bacterium]
MSVLRPDELWGRDVYDASGRRLGRIEAIGMGRDRLPRRVAVRLDEARVQLTFFSLAGARVTGDRVVIADGATAGAPDESPSIR